MLTEKSLASFEKVRVRITFRDGEYKDRAIAATYQIGFSESSMQIIAWKLLEFLKKEKYKKLFESGQIPKIDEENLHLILEIAKELKIDWPVLMNVTLDLKKISSQGFISNHLFLEVGASHRLITLLLQKLKLNNWTPSQILVEIDKIVQTYGKGKIPQIITG